MYFKGHFQNAYVTRDLTKAVELVKAQYDFRDFVYFEPNTEVYTAKGRGPSVVKVALAWSGNLQIELIEPVSGLVDMYRDYLGPDHRPRFHHICMRTHDYDQTRAEIERKKWTVAYEGAVPGVKFIYADTRDTLGHYVEYLWASPEMWDGMGGPASFDP